MKRNRNRDLRKRETALSSISKKMILVVLGLLVIFVSTQFIKLATVGTLGVKISRVKQDQEMFELENEILRSEISELKAPSKLEEVLIADPNLEPKSVTIISSNDITDEKIIAQR